MASATVAVPAGSPVGGYLWPRSSEQAAEIQVGVLLLGQPKAQVAVVSAEILLFNQSLAKAISRAFKAKGLQKTLFTASHSHSGPGGFGRDGLEKIVLGKAQKMERLLVEGTQDALNIAISKPLKPLFLSQAKTNVLLRRTKSTEPLDDRLGIVHCGEKELWLMHAAHPVTETDDKKVNGDWPALLVNDLKKHGFNEVMYASSSGGEVSLARAKGRGHTVKRLGRKVLKAIQKKVPILDSIQLTSLSLTVPDMTVPLTPNWQLTGPLVQWIFPTAPKAEIQILSTKQLDWFFLPYEASATLWPETQRKPHEETFLFHTPFNGTYLGYVIPRSAWSAGPNNLSLLGPDAATEHGRWLEKYLHRKNQSPNSLVINFRVDMSRRADHEDVDPFEPGFVFQSRVVPPANPPSPAASIPLLPTKQLQQHRLQCHMPK